VKSPSLNEANWDEKQYNQTLESFSGLSEMISEPFSLGLILKVLPKLIEQEKTEKEQGLKFKYMSRSHVYEAFSDQWFDKEVIRLQKTNKLPNNKTPKEMKKSFEQYSQDLAFEMFFQETQVVMEPSNEDEDEDGDEDDNNDADNGYYTFDLNDDEEEKNTASSMPNNGDENENESESDSDEPHLQNNEKSISAKEIWRKFFEGKDEHGLDALIYLKGSPLRRVGKYEYMFIHKSYQEYFASQKNYS